VLKAEIENLVRAATETKLPLRVAEEAALLLERFPDCGLTLHEVADMVAMRAVGAGAAVEL
jgi:hypothetical protein